MVVGRETQCQAGRAGQLRSCFAPSCGSLGGGLLKGAVCPPFREGEKPACGGVGHFRLLSTGLLPRRSPLHLKRWLTALVALPLLLLVIIKGGLLLFDGVVLLIGALGLWEFLGLLRPERQPGGRLPTIGLGALLILGFALTTGKAPGGTPAGPLVPLAGCFFLIFLWHLARFGRNEQLLADLAADTLALCYLPFLLGHLVWLRRLSEGEWWVLWLLAVIFAGDTTAFYVGQTWGRRKLSPAVSPGKTWEGTLGGLAGSVVAGGVAGYWLLPGASLPFLLALALALGMVGVLGDLFESMLKRKARVKDASQLLPGHGGLLDRLDSILFAGPLVVYARLFICQG